MMRVCHLDTCPVGVATQNPELRKRFSGKPEFVVNFFEFIAEEVRELMAELGFRTVAEMVGHAELIDTRPAVDHWKAKGLDLSPILTPCRRTPTARRSTSRCSQDHGLAESLDAQLVEMCKAAIDDGAEVEARPADPEREPHCRHDARQ